jgi:uncharacterized protein (TIGR02001 family)
MKNAMIKGCIVTNLHKVAAVAVTGLVLISAAPVSAAEMAGIPGTFSANVGFVSEYYFRGISQNDDAPAIQGGFDYEVEIAKPTSFYLGVWGSNVDFNEASGIDGATMEMDVYGGLKGTIGKTGVSWSLGGIYYMYPGADSTLNYDFFEIAGSLGYDFGPAAVTASLNYSPDNFGASGTAYYPKLAVSAPVPAVKGLSVNGYVAKQYIKNETAFGSPDYIEWNFGVGYSIAGFDLSLNYSDTDISPSADGKKEAVIFGIKRAF